MGTTQHPILRRYPLGAFRNFLQSHASAPTLTHCPSKSALIQHSATFRQVAACFCSSMLRIFTFRTVSAGLSAGFFRRTVHRAQSFRWIFRRVSAQMRRELLRSQSLEDPVPLAGPQGRRVLRGASTLTEIGPTNRRWTDARRQSDKKLSDTFPHCPPAWASLSFSADSRREHFAIRETFSRNSPREPPKDPRNSHSLLELPDNATECDNELGNEQSLSKRGASKRKARIIICQIEGARTVKCKQ